MVQKWFKEGTISKDAIEPQGRRGSRNQGNDLRMQERKELDKGRMLYGAIIERELDGLYQFSRMR
jgi:hypothetical protein